MLFGPSTIGHARAPAGLRAALVVWLGASAIGLASGCATDAVAIDACRDIQAARCEAAPVCEDSDPSFGIVTEEQVQNCKTFYIDGCMVGVENPDAAPSGDDVVNCTDSIALVAKCQSNGVATMADCMDAGDTPETLAVEGQEGKNPCEALRSPEILKTCAFVAAPPEEE